MLQKITENHSALLQENQNRQALWKAVVLQALLDLKSTSKKKMAKCARNQADKWINLYNKNFLRVCGLADLDPDYVISHKRKIIAEREMKLRKVSNEESNTLSKSINLQDNSTELDSTESKRLEKLQKHRVA